MAGDGEFFPNTKVEPICPDGPRDPAEPTPKGLTFMDCVDKHDLKPIGAIPPPPDLRSTGDKALEIVGGIASIFAPSNAAADQPTPNQQHAREAEQKLENRAWDEFFSKRDVFHTEDQARAAYYTLMRGMQLTTRDDGKGTLTPEQLQYVNFYGRNNSAHDGHSPYSNPHFVRHYTDQKS